MKKLFAFCIVGFLIISIAIPGVAPVVNFDRDYVHIGEYTFE